jgi:alcohol dehydrogenase
MKAAVFHHPKKVKVEEFPDPILEKEDDIIVKVTSTAICGSDLHIYNGFMPQWKNMVLGHEFMGIVEEVGKEVKHLKKGDRVLVPCIIACGHCFFCQHQLYPQCENSNDNYGPQGGMFKEKGGGVFGYTDLYGGYNGGQAELVRVPFANMGPRKIEEEIKDEEILFITDIFPTGWTAIERAGLKGGETVAVFGCGPVGIMVQKSAWLQGAGRVIGIDILNYRLEIARKAAKSETINLNETNIIEALRDMTEGRGPDVCVDAVGLESHRDFSDKLLNFFRLQMGSAKTVKHCISAVRRGGVVSIIGVYGNPYSLPLGQIFDKAISIHTGAVPAQRYTDSLLQMVKEKKVVLDDIITHVLPLDQAAYAYDIFCNKKDDCLKVVLKP